MTWVILHILESLLNRMGLDMCRHRAKPQLCAGAGRLRARQKELMGKVSGFTNLQNFLNLGNQ